MYEVEIYAFAHPRPLSGRLIIVWIGMAEDASRNPTEDTETSIAGRVTEDVSTFTSVTNDFYRGEIDRSTTWRARLDQTTNWAVVLVAAILTWAFSSPDNPHFVILIGVFGATAFLLMEANRYREYDIWRDRVRTLQQDFYAAVYAPDHVPDAEWQSTLSEELGIQHSGCRFNKLSRTGCVDPIFPFC